MKKNIYKECLDHAFEEHANVLKNTHMAIAKSAKLSADIIAKSLTSEGTIFWCGNGGSAADSQHIAAEFVGRFKKDRRPLRSIALTTDTSVLTCVSNDYSFEEIFSRQINALGRNGDVLVVITTSGNSENILSVLRKAKEANIESIALLGKGGGEAAKIASRAIIIDSNETARIQEIHLLIGHTFCEYAELNVFNLG